MSDVSETVMSAVEAALPTQGPGIRPCEVEGVVYSRISIRHALRQLVAEGRATFTGEDCKRRYRRAGR